MADRHSRRQHPCRLVVAAIVAASFPPVVASAQSPVPARLTLEEALARTTANSRRLGELDPPPNQENGRMSPPGYPDIYVVSNVLDDKGQPIGALGAGEAAWHTDMSYLEAPPDASMLYALELPPSGGDTWFCGMQAAFAAM